MDTLRTCASGSSGSCPARGSCLTRGSRVRRSSCNPWRSRCARIPRRTGHRRRCTRWTHGESRQVRCCSRKNGCRGCTVHAEVQPVPGSQIQKHQERNDHGSRDNRHRVVPVDDAVLEDLNTAWRSRNPAIDEDHEFNPVRSGLQYRERARRRRKGDKGCGGIVGSRGSNEHVKELR